SDACPWRGARTARTRSDARKLVDARALRLVLAVGVPRNESEPAEHEDERGAEADPEPDPVEDHDREHAQQENPDRDSRELEPVLGNGPSLRALPPRVQALVETPHDEATLGAVASRVHPAGGRELRLRVLRRGGRSARPGRVAAPGTRPACDRA